MTWLGQVSGRLSGHEIGTDYITVAADGTRISDYYGVLTAHEERLCLSRDSRPRQGLRPSLRPSHSGNWDPRPSDCAALTLENGHVERLIGSIRRECLDHLVVFDEAQLRRVLKNYASYYNQVRTHLSLDKNAPDFRRPQKLGPIAAISILGGLHH